MDPLEELRLLLLRREREQLGELQERLDDKEKRARELSGVLPLAITLSRERSADLTRSLQPSFEESIRVSLEKRPEMFVEALSPIIGSIVRRSIAESLRGLVQSINKTLEHTFSIQGLKWRYEAVRTGRSFAEVVMLRSMIYRVEELFLIHRETSLTLLHLSADGGEGSDSDLVAGMLSAIRDFAVTRSRPARTIRWTSSASATWNAGSFRAATAYLAAAIRGTPPRELRATLETAIENIHILKGPELARFNGDAAVFEPVRPELENCLGAKFKEDDAAAAGGSGQYTKALVVLGAVAALVVFVGVLIYGANRRWQDFLNLLNEQPGIAVTSSHRAWWGNSRVNGLRDPLSRRPRPFREFRRAQSRKDRIQLEKLPGAGWNEHSPAIRAAFPDHPGNTGRFQGWRCGQSQRNRPLRMGRTPAPRRHRSAGHQQNQRSGVADDLRSGAVSGTFY